MQVGKRRGRSEVSLASASCLKDTSYWFISFTRLHSHGDESGASVSFSRWKELHFQPLKAEIPLGDLGGSSLQTTKCRKAPKVAERVTVSVEGFVAGSRRRQLERCLLWGGEMVILGTLGHGEEGEAVGQKAAEGCGGEARGWQGVRASCRAAWAASTVLHRETASV